jgi:hypothetical protein
MNSMNDLLNFLVNLEGKDFSYRLEHNREDGVHAATVNEILSRLEK